MVAETGREEETKRTRHRDIKERQCRRAMRVLTRTRVSFLHRNRTETKRKTRRAKEQKDTWKDREGQRETERKIEKEDRKAKYKGHVC